MDIHTQQMREIAELALRVGREKREQLASLKVALKAGDNEKALSIARKLCGMEDDEQTSASWNKTSHTKKGVAV